MLNKEKERELAYIVKVDSIEPIDGRDRVESAVVGGWTCMVRKGSFFPGAYGVYFEIDSKLPEKEPFMFLESTKFKIKTQKYKTPNGHYYSQGLLMPFKDFVDEDGRLPFWLAEVNSALVNGIDIIENEEYRFLTKAIGVTYADAEDNKRKAKTVDKYTKMAQRMSEKFSKQPYKWLMKRMWGKKLLFAFYSNIKDNAPKWPSWVEKTDEERVQNMPWILKNTDPWIATEKIDGTSTTFTMKRVPKKFFGREEYKFYVCSRNVVFDKPDKKCYYDTNVYLEMAEKYNVEEVLKTFLSGRPDLEWVTLQGETYGAGIQKRDYGLKDHRFMGFNFITSAEGRYNSIEAAKLFKSFGIPWVPIVNEFFLMPSNRVSDMLNIATGFSKIDGKMREGLVFRSFDGKQSFKAVSNEFLAKYHQ